MAAFLRRAAGPDPSGQPSDAHWISLRYFSAYRIVVAAVFMAVTFIDETLFGIGSYSLAAFRYVDAGYLFLAIVFHALLRLVPERFDAQLSAQVLLDIVAITLLMNASGGMSSGLGVMVLISLTGAALVAPLRLMFLYPAVAAIALLLEQTYWVLVHDAPTANYLQPGLLSIAYFATAGATGWLAQRVAANARLARQRGRELGIQLRVNQLVIRDMHDGVVVLDPDGRVMQHNPQALRLLGIEPLLGVALPRALPGLAASWNRWRSGTTSAELPWVDLEARGKGMRVRLLDAGTEEDGYSVLFLEDISRLKDQAQQLKLAAMGRITANIAHEIRNPLSAISHAAQLLDEDGHGDERARLTRIINDNTRRLDRLVADVMQLNRRDRLLVERIRLGPWLDAFIAEFASNESVPKKRFSVHLEKDVTVAFDRDHLRQVLWNLLRNAVRHAGQGPGAVRVVVKAFADQVELNVIDDGPGVPQSVQGQLFEPFFTTDSTGTGLGLYLARELCMANRAVLEYVNSASGAHFRMLCGEAEAT